VISSGSGRVMRVTPKNLGPEIFCLDLFERAHSFGFLQKESHGFFEIPEFLFLASG